jgi:hypothetical protein
VADRAGHDDRVFGPLERVQLLVEDAIECTDKLVLPTARLETPT